MEQKLEETLNQNDKELESSIEGEAEQAEEKLKREKVDCSHRVIEKRRRDRINNSLLQLSKLVPVEKFNKKNSNKLEKAEILEVTVNYLTQQQVEKTKLMSTKKDNQTSEESELSDFLRGFKQCLAHATKFFQDVEELDISEGRCYRLIQHLKKEISRYERKEKDHSKAPIEERGVWDAEETSFVSHRRNSRDSTTRTKRKNSDQECNAPCKKPRNSPEPSSCTEQSSSEQDQSSSERSSSPSNSNTGSSTSNTDSDRNYMPVVFPNMPMFATFPFAGANNMPVRFQSSQAQYPSYQYQQSTPQYIPVALPQFPMMGMNFLPGFGMANGEQGQNGGVPCTSTASSLPMPNVASNNTMPGLMPNGIPNGFFPSMYTNGVHANMMAMRPRDSGYESSELSSSSKSSGSNISPQSLSDDSCQSFVS